MLYLISFLLLINALFSPKSAFANCSLKKGIGGPGGCPDVPQLDQLQEQINISWFYTWHYCTGATEDIYWNASIEYVPMIRNLHSGFNRATVEKIVNDKNHQGKYWLIGNEPERSDQDNLTPTQAAEEYGKIAYLIKEVDSAAKIIMLGLENPKNWWKNQFLNAWRQRWPQSSGCAPPEEVITGWHVHLYALPHQNESWEDARMRVKTYLTNWINDNPDDKELWVTEYGCTYRKDLETMSDFTNFLEENPRVNRYAYFYFGEPPGWAVDWEFTSLYDTNPQWPHATDLANLYASLPNNPQSSCAISPTSTPTPTPTATPIPTVMPTLPLGITPLTPTPTATPTLPPGITPTTTSTPTPDTACDCQGSSRTQRQGGDYNCSGGVTLSDLTLWVNCYFWGNSPSSCDYNCDGQANMGDYNTWWNGLGS